MRLALPLLFGVSLCGPTFLLAQPHAAPRSMESLVFARGAELPDAPLPNSDRTSQPDAVTPATQFEAETGQKADQQQREKAHEELKEQKSL